AKKADGPYRSGRTRDWLKIKCQRRQEFVIGGYTDPQGARAYFGALHLGVYDGDRLVYVSKVGTGFDATSLKRIRDRLKPPAREPLLARGWLHQGRPRRLLRGDRAADAPLSRGSAAGAGALSRRHRRQVLLPEGHARLRSGLGAHRADPLDHAAARHRLRRRRRRRDAALPRQPRDDP